MLDKMLPRVRARMRRAKKNGPPMIAVSMPICIIFELNRTGVNVNQLGRSVNRGRDFQ